MNPILSSWKQLTPQKKAVAVLAVLATVVTLFMLGRLATTPQMALLYSGLDSATSSEIVTSLEQKSISFEIRGDAIYVDSSQRDRARMTLAGEGLPSNGVAGYELLDSLSGFGTTTQMFDAAYWRAKEGELARTILASGQINMARVHIAKAAQRPFERGNEPTASVTVTNKGGALGVKQAESIRHLVAAAVAGLSPQQVAVIDAEYGVILQPGEEAVGRGNTGDIDSRAAELRANVERLLSARVGAGNAIVEVMVETQTESETLRERLVDPESSVAISSDTESSTENSTGGANGAVTVASNLPDTEGTSGSGQDTRNQTQTRERINYEVSETVRERVRLPGDIARLSVAVLVNNERSVSETGEVTYTPRSQEELTAFQSLVQSAVGFNPERGDVVTIETMQFPEPVIAGTAATPSMFSGFALNIPLILQMAILGIVAMVLGLFVVRPILTNPAPQIAALPNAATSAAENDSSVIDGSAIPANQAALKTQAIARDPVEILRETIENRSSESSLLLRNWIESDASETPEKA